MGATEACAAVLEGFRMEPPQLLVEDPLVAEIMRDCWAQQADARPTFHDIAKQLHAAGSAAGVRGATIKGSNLTFLHTVDMAEMEDETAL